MSGTVIEWGGVTRLDLPPERIVRRALEADLSGVVVIGYTAEGAFYFASSYADGGEVVWLLEMAKSELLALVKAQT